MTIIHKTLSDIQTTRGVREKEAAFEHNDVDCSDIPELTETDFRNAVRRKAGEVGSGPVAARMEIYKDRSGRFRWRLVAENGEILAVSASGYVSRKACQRAISMTRAAFAADGV